MKVFVIVGSLFPFDRLIKLIDSWAGNNKEVTVTGQIGRSSYRPKNMKYYERLSSKDFNSCFSESDLIISHAGMGVILKSLVESKPVVILPRRLDLKEHTTDHQIATAKAIKRMHYLNVAMTDEELISFLKKPNEIVSKYKIGDNASDNLINALKEFIDNN